MRGRCQDGGQRLVQRRLGQGFSFGVHHRFEVVEQHHHRLPRREGLQQSQHHLSRAMLRVLVQALQSLCLFGWQQPQQVRDQGRVLHLVGACAAQVHDPAYGDCRGVAFHVRDPANFQALEQPAYHGGLADAAAAGHGHQPDPRIGHMPSQQAGLHLPVLEPGRRGRGRRVDEFRRPHRMRFGGDLLTLDSSADPQPYLGQLPQRALHQQPERVRAGERLGNQLGCPAPGGGTRLAGRRTRDRSTATTGCPTSSASMSSRNTSRSMPASVAALNSSSVYDTFGPVPHRGAVPGAQHPHIYIAHAHPLDA